MGPKVVIVGAGIVGTSLADELTARGLSEVTVVDRGALFATGGSTSHAPGLVFATNASHTMSAFARYTVEKFSELRHPGGPVFNRVGGLEVATTAPRWADLQRKAGWAQACGIPGRLLGAAECAALHPLLDREQILGGFHTPTDGLAAAVRAAEAQARRATARGAAFVPGTEVLGVVDRNGRVRGVRTGRGVIDADIVVCAAGFWGGRAGPPGRADPAAGADGPPVRHDRAGRPAGGPQHRRARRGPADPAPPGRRSVLP